MGFGIIVLLIKPWASEQAVFGRLRQLFNGLLTGGSTPLQKLNILTPYIIYIGVMLIDSGKNSRVATQKVAPRQASAFVCR